MSILNTPELNALWQNAQSKPEWATTKFWEYLFKHSAFADHRWSVASQQPPTQDPSDLRRVDLVVERISDSTTLLFMEAKRAYATKDLVQEVEYQAYVACCANLLESQRGAVWAMTCVGTATRLWAFHIRHDYLTAYYPLGSGLSELSEYVEISTHGRQVLEGLEYIKNHPIPPEKIFKGPQTPRPANAVLPANWHDREAVLLAAAANEGGTEADWSSGAEAGPSNWTAATPLQAAGTLGAVGQPDEPVQSAQPGALVADKCTQLVLAKISGGKHTFKRPNGKTMDIAPGEWAPYYIHTSAGVYEGYGYTDKHGTEYYTWSLELEEAPKSSGKKKK